MAKGKKAVGSITISMEDLNKLIADGVEAGIKAMSVIKHNVTQDQHDLLSVIAPDKLSRHEYTVKG